MTASDPAAPATAGRPALDPRTGEPRRPFLAWATLLLFLAGAGVTLAALLIAMWTAVRHFEAASWLTAAVPTALGDPFRVVLVAALWLSAVLIGAVASITGYYAWAGYSWTRWAALVAVGVGGLSFLGGWLAPWCLAPIALGAIVTWLPAMRRFFQDWDALRRPAAALPSLPDQIVYGPLPRYS